MFVFYHSDRDSGFTSCLFENLFVVFKGYLICLHHNEMLDIWKFQPSPVVFNLFDKLVYIINVICIALNVKDVIPKYC